MRIEPQNSSSGIGLFLLLILVIVWVVISIGWRLHTYPRLSAMYPGFTEQAMDYVSRYWFWIGNLFGLAISVSVYALFGGTPFESILYLLSYFIG